MRVLVAALGSRGDVQPGFALAMALRRAGHEAVVSAPPDFAAWSTELGLPFVAGDDASIEALLKANLDDVGANPVRVMRLLGELVHKHVPLWFERTLAAADGADAIVSAGQFASVSVAEKLGIPYHGVAYSPTMLPSAWHPPIMFPWQRLPRWANVFFWRCFRFGMERAKPAMEAARSRMGLPPLRSLWHHLVDVPYFLACDPVLAPAPPDWSSRPITATGPWFYDDPGELAPEVEEFLAAGPAPVYVGFGSMVTDDVAGVTRTILEGAGANGRRVLLSKGWAGLGEGSLPPNVKVVHTPMPHAKLFPRMAAVVHHGGSGTIANALRASVPQVIVPHIMDQFYYAERLLRLGLAPRGIPIKRLSASTLARAIDATLALDPAPRRAMAERLRAGDGIAHAIAILEARVGERRAPARAPSSIAAVRA